MHDWQACNWGTDQISESSAVCSFALDVPPSVLRIDPTGRCPIWCPSLHCSQEASGSFLKEPASAAFCLFRVVCWDLGLYAWHFHLMHLVLSPTRHMSSKGLV